MICVVTHPETHRFPAFLDVEQEYWCRMTQLWALFAYVCAAAAEAIIRRFQFLPSPSPLSQDKINAHPTHKTRKKEGERKEFSSVEDGRPTEGPTDSSIANRTDTHTRLLIALCFYL